MKPATRIIGIDPGLRHTGWGVIAVEGTRLSYIACGAVEPSPAADLADRLAAIHEGLRGVIREHAPEEAAVEETFLNKDPRATLKLGAARGVAMLVPAQAGLRVAEYAPNQIKKAVVGAGHAEKAQIRMMVKVLLPKAEFRTDDMADALAIAICHAHHRGRER
ncbi:crossover junction endodeoxyribonuclease RuvC [Rhabdaerophilum calidifontis]|uniref:crossover junction endodeoxyribonuclease RuvC n=1 Tax=Rhabdaerophilum calidifontis TaxID=2604328 RepID=UPI0012390F10|nr:crossover junction endodeoxyribonuclease RuvC [Rhabdaerophilum calidifontis]